MAEGEEDLWPGRGARASIDLRRERGASSAPTSRRERATGSPLGPPPAPAPGGGRAESGASATHDPRDVHDDCDGEEKDPDSDETCHDNLGPRQRRTETSEWSLCCDAADAMCDRGDDLDARLPDDGWIHVAGRGPRST